jgi:hypothetical protein
MKQRKAARTAERPTRDEERIRRFPFLHGGNRTFRSLSAEKRLAHLQGTSEGGRARRMIAISPSRPVRRKPFNVILQIQGRKKTAALARIQVIFPSGMTREFDYKPSRAERTSGRLTLRGFSSAQAGDFYVSARIYFTDGSTLSDARLASVLSANPDQLVITPRAWLVSGNAGRVEYDWDTNEFHCRAYATITNGSVAARTFRRCSVRVTDGGVGGSLINAFSFNVGPFTVQPSQSAYRTVDTWYPQGNSVWDKFNKRWDLTVQFTYEADGGISVQDAAVYRPMSTVPINAIKTTDFTAAQTSAERAAVAIAAEILEDRDVTLNGPNWRILSRQADKDRFGIIDIDWSSDYWDFDEANDLYEEISGPDADRLDVFIPVAFGYTAAVPADKRNVGGFSTENGPFPKDNDPRRSACMVLLDENDHDFFGVAVAHEICHYMGLPHVDAEDNLMHKNGGLTGHRLTWEQWNTIKQHGMMKWLAPDI